MFSGTVVGMVVSSRKHDALVGYKLLRVALSAPSHLADEIVVIDQLGAGMGDTVLVAIGSAARVAADINAPVDAAVVGIVDPA